MNLLFADGILRDRWNLGLTFHSFFGETMFKLSLQQRNFKTRIYIDHRCWLTPASGHLKSLSENKCSWSSFFSCRSSVSQVKRKLFLPDSCNNLRWDNKFWFHFQRESSAQLSLKLVYCRPVPTSFPRSYSVRLSRSNNSEKLTAMDVSRWRRQCADPRLYSRMCTAVVQLRYIAKNIVT